MSSTCKFHIVFALGWTVLCCAYLALAVLFSLVFIAPAIVFAIGAIIMIGGYRD